MKLGPLQEKWLQALESGEYEQAKGHLMDIVTSPNGKMKACCLGVACDVLGLDKCRAEGRPLVAFFYGERSSTAEMPLGSYKKLGLKSELGEISLGHPTFKSNCLSAANDNGATFKQIAAFIRANPEKVFTKSI